MNVLICSSNGDVSGASLSMLRLARHLRDDLNINVSISVPCNGEIEKMAIDEGIPNHIVREVRWTWAVPYGECAPIKSRIGLLVKKAINRKAIRQFKYILKQEKIDIVHINTLTCHCAAVAANELGIPVVWHIREFLEEDIGVYFWDKEYAYELIRKSKRIIAISQSIFDKYSKCLVSDRIVKVLNGIDATIYGVEDHKLFNDKNIHIAIIGMVKEAKGQLELIRALGLLYSKGVSNFIVEIVGSGDLEYIEKLKETAKQCGISEKVIFLGQIKDVRSILKKTDIACVCSKMEAFGRSTVEAMMAGCLVIGANTGGTVELISDGDTGLLYQQGNVNSLADKIALAVENFEYARCMAAKGNKIAREQYSSYNNAYIISRIYSEVKGEVERQNK